MMIVDLSPAYSPEFSGRSAIASTALGQNPNMPPLTRQEAKLIPLSDQQKLRGLIDTIENSQSPALSTPDHVVGNLALLAHTAKRMAEVLPTSADTLNVSASLQVASPHLQEQMNSKAAISVVPASKPIRRDRRVTSQAKARPSPPPRKLTSNSSFDPARRMGLGVRATSEKPSRLRAPETLMDAFDMLLTGR
jgi:hypothetical protein